MTDRNFQVAGLGEVAIRCDAMAPMVDFYHRIIGLELLSGGPTADITFFRIAEGVGGHTTVLALFDKRAGRSDLHDVSAEKPFTGPRSSLHHIALSLPYDQQAAAMAWYDSLGIAYNVQTFDWIGWRGVFTRDPENNVVELVAKDPDWVDPNG
ncbi:MAG: VOC family protein [Pseudomonadota bacterium]